MAETIQRAKKIGGSLMVRIPKDIVAMENIQPGEAVRVDFEKLRKDWFGAFPGLKPFKKEEDRFRFRHE
jgi:hypothetical protein